MVSFDVTFTAEDSFPIIFEASESLAADFDNTVRIGDFNVYEGEYEFTPTDQDQRIPTEALLLRQDIIIRAIPETYGHIGWNGSTLTVY